MIAAAIWFLADSCVPGFYICQAFAVKLGGYETCFLLFPGFGHSGTVAVIAELSCRLLACSKLFHGQIRSDSDVQEVMLP